MDQSKMKRQISNVFKMNGLSIKSDGVKHLYQMLEPLGDSQHDQWIEKIIDAIQKLPLPSSVIGHAEIEKAAKNLSLNENDDIESLIQVINAPKIPKLIYNVERKKFLLDNGVTSSLHGTSDDKASLFVNRYISVFQRTTNHELFRNTTVKLGENEDKKFDLVKVEYLRGLGSLKKDVVVLGLLTRLTEGEFHIEDDTGFVKIDLSNTKFHNGLFTVNCFVLIEGWFEDGTLHCNAVGLPPAETSEVSRALMGNINYFGNSGSTCQKYVEKIQKIEAENTDAMMVFMSDVWLDKIKVMEKLQTLFRGYADCPPVAFIFCGNFTSESHGPQQAADLKCLFGALGDAICNYPQLLEKTKFIFVPGPNDPGPGNIFPMPPLPKRIQEEILAKVPNCIFTSNPCRILYCTQEIVIFREDIFTKMCRNSVFFPADSTNIASHFARTLVSQAHLSPLPLHTVPVYWGLDHCLSLHPTPDLIITADKGDPFTTEFNSCLVVNPGSFVKNDFSFKVYMPSGREVEDSQIIDEEEAA